MYIVCIYLRVSDLPDVCLTDGLYVGHLKKSSYESSNYPIYRFQFSPNVWAGKGN